MAYKALNSQVLNVLNSAPSRIWKRIDVWRELPEYGRQEVSQRLNHLWQRGVVTKTMKGYQARGN